MRHADKLIEAVRNRPVLYDRSLQTFRHLTTKNQSWREVAKIVYSREDNATVNKVRIQWKSLRDAFVKQQRKRQSGTPAKIRPYCYESEMKFLLSHILSKDRDDVGEDYGLSSTFDVKTEDAVSLNASSSGDSQQPETPVDEFIWKQQKIQKDGFSERDNMHPVDAFFHGVAQTVKQLQPATIAQLKKTIANVVMDAEIQELESENKNKDTCS